MSNNATASRAFTVQDIQNQIKPLSKNGLAAFFQKLWRGWLAIWYSFSDKRPKLAAIIYKLGFFIIFSQGVTIVQLLLFLFLPHLFGQELAATEWLWPGIKMFTSDSGQIFYFHLLGKPIIYENGVAVIGGGLGYFFAFLIATFLAQCINFPLQRNITFKSHGNPYYQAMWYFIGWLLIQPFCDGLASLYNPLVNGMLGFQIPVVLKVILDTIVMGGVAMVIFFFVFLVIFPDYNTVEKRARAKVEKLKSSGADPAKIALAETALVDAAMKARVNNAEKAEAKAATQANAKAMNYFAIVKNIEKAKASGQDTALFVEKKEAGYQQAIVAIETKLAAEKDFKAALAEAGK